MSTGIENKKSDGVDENIFSTKEKISEVADHQNKSVKTSTTSGYSDLNSCAESPQIEINRFFNELPIRILNSHEEPFFYLEDIAKILAIKNPRKTVANFEGREIVTLDQRQKYNIVTYKIHRGKPVRDDRKILLTEAGVYRIIFTTKSQLSGVFRDWVYDVLRQLRLTGEYKVNAELQQLKTVNETLLKENNHLKQFTDDLIKKQDKFKNLCEKLYLVEFPNNPLEIEQTNLPKFLIKKHSQKLKYNTVDNLYAYAVVLDKELKLNTPFIETDPDTNLNDLKIAHSKNTEIAKIVIDKFAPKFSYLITDKITPEILTAGTVRHSMWVRNSKESLANIDKSLLSYKSLRIKDRYNLYLCDKEKIINEMNLINVIE
jgi:prophage antirepressor-like protein